MPFPSVKLFLVTVVRILGLVVNVFLFVEVLVVLGSLALSVNRALNLFDDSEEFDSDDELFDEDEEYSFDSDEEDFDSDEE